MTLKTIINTKEDFLSRCLVLSLMVHGVVWSFVPDPRSELVIAQNFERAPDRFVSVEVPASVPEKVAQPQPKADKPAANQPKPQRQRVKKRRVRRKSRRSAKRRPVRERTPKSQSPKVDEPQVVVQKVLAKEVQQANVETPSVTQVNKPVAQLVARIKLPGQQVKKRLTRGQLRGILKGYYRSLNVLMRKERSYPRSARRLGLEGTVLVQMVVNKKGEILDVKVARSSGHDLLDKAAIAQVQNIQRVPKIPHELNRPSMTFQIPFEYRLQS